MAQVMRHYHQPYSEVKEMPFEYLLFLVSLIAEETKYQKHLQDKEKNKWKHKMGRIRR